VFIPLYVNGQVTSISQGNSQKEVLDVNKSLFDKLKKEIESSRDTSLFDGANTNDSTRFYDYFLTELLLMVSTMIVEGQLDSLLTAEDTPDNIKDLLSIIAQAKEKKTSADASLEIDGLLIDNTKTKTGTDFYEYFYRDWVAPPKARDYSIFITEKPYRLSTTMIEVYINETLVFQSFLQPRNAVIEELAGQAVAQTGMYLQNYEEIVRQLDGDDRSGSGYY
jgi:curli production assembly/transport component CsgE